MEHHRPPPLVPSYTAMVAEAGVRERLAWRHTRQCSAWVRVESVTFR